MDTIKDRANEISAPINSIIFSSQLIETFKQHAANIDVLSLDCFDTLLWRRVAAPRDIFYELNFEKINPSMRVRGERFAQHLKKVQENKSQVTLTEIYRAIFPDYDEQEINELVEFEFAKEMENLYAFQPIVELIKLAMEMKKQVIVVSDIYFTEVQLTNLLKNKLPAEIINSIKKIFCSCEHGKSKTEGLFEIVVNELNFSPHKIFHIGDNPHADLYAPQRSGIKACQLIRYVEPVAEIFRAQTVAAGFLDQRIRNSRALVNPFQALFAQKNLEKNSSLIGYLTLGPILFSFAKFIHNEKERISAQGKNPKLLFLMRDAYLPLKVFRALYGEDLGLPIKISRFASIASTFRTKREIDHYLAENMSSNRFEDMCKQFLLPAEFTQQIINRIAKTQQPQEEFIRLIHEENTLQLILQQSQKYRQRLIRYLEKQAGIKTGDTLMFVDLGYSGSTQNKLTALFKDDLKIEIAGCYLIAFKPAKTQRDRNGLLDAADFDDSVLSMLVSQISLVEQLCTSMEKSVVDFDEAGDPIYVDFSANSEKKALVSDIQAECVNFAKEAEHYLQQYQLEYNISDMRDVTALNLARFLFFPTKLEISQLESMTHDVNLGTNAVIPLVNFDQSFLSLRKRSWLYCLKDKATQLRMNYAAEWRAASIDLAITLMAQLRYDFEIAFADLSHVREKINVILSVGGNFIFDAFPTHLGYLAVVIPVIPNTEMGIQFGLKYKWMELQSADLIQIAHLYKETETLHTENANAHLSGDQLADKGGGLFECVTPNAMLIFKTPPSLSATTHVLKIVFRPVVRS